MQNSQKEISFYDFFTPFTSKKAIIFLILIGITVFFNALFNGFVWDDVAYILLNSDLHSINFHVLFGPNFFNRITFYRPLTATYFALLYNLFATNAFPYHFIEIAIHILNSIILFYVFKKFFDNTLSFLLSVIFLIQPLQVESVSYISSSINVLFFFFGVSALYISMISKVKLKHYLLISFFLFLSLLTKETAVIFIIAIVVYTFLYKRKQSLVTLPFITLPIIGYFLMRIFFGKVFFTIEKGSLIPIQNLSILRRLISVPEMVWYYVRNFFLPIHLAIDQLWIIRQINFSSFYFPLILDCTFFVLIFALSVLIFKKHKSCLNPYLFFLTIFLLSFGMILQIFPLDMTVADRWFYLPTVGLVGLIGTTVTIYKNFILKHKNIFISLTTFFLLFFALRTIIRNADWIDNLTLFSKDVQVESNFDIEGMLGAEYASFHQTSQAITHLKKSINYLPHDTSLYNLGKVYEDSGNFINARIYYQKAVDISQQSEVKKNAYLGLARVLILYNKPEIAREFLNKAIKIYPNESIFWIYLALSEYWLRDQKNALISAGKAKQLAPTNLSTLKLYNRIYNNQEVHLINK